MEQVTSHTRVRRNKVCVSPRRLLPAADGGRIRRLLSRLYKTNVFFIKSDRRRRGAAQVRVGGEERYG